MKSDNIISFPLRSNLPITPELIEEWQRGLASRDYGEQWRTFERMSSFTDIYVLQLVQDFLLLETGEALLKTRLLQTLKKTCPASLTFQIKKGNQLQTVSLAEVPLSLEDWSEPDVAPFTTMEKKAFADPSLIELARDVWCFFLEKSYPFSPQIKQDVEWSAGLHVYTLATMNEELVNQLLKEELPSLYDFSTEQLVQFYDHFVEQIS